MMLGRLALSKKRGLSNERNFQGCCLRNPLQAIEQCIVCLFDLAFWIEPEALTSWDFLIPTPAEICDCQTDFPLGEEEDDGRYLADEWYLSLYMEGEP